MVPIVKDRFVAQENREGSNEELLALVERHAGHTLHRNHYLLLGVKGTHRILFTQHSVASNGQQWSNPQSKFKESDQ